ncbi:TrmB family transcriptional regulator [Nanoarchaeota archaeon]
MNLDILRKIGLSEGELKIYSALLDLGRAPINKIHESTGIERRNIYDILNKLIERGLVTYITENKKRFFQISHPNKIIGYLEEKEHNLNKTKKEIEKEIPSIIEKFNVIKPDINSEIFRGVEGVKAVWDDMLNYRDVFWIGSGRFFPKAFPIWFKNWNKRRIEAKTKFINLFIHEMKKELKVLPLEEVRFLPKEFSGNPTMICIFGNKVINFMMGKDLFAFVIESKQLAENYKKYHKYLWDNVAK